MQHSASAPIDLLSRAFMATKNQKLNLTERMLLLEVQRDGSEDTYLPLVDEKLRKRQLRKKLKQLHRSMCSPLSKRQTASTANGAGDEQQQQMRKHRRPRRVSPQKQERLDIIESTSPYLNPKKLLANCLSHSMYD